MFQAPYCGFYTPSYSIYSSTNWLKYRFHTTDVTYCQSGFSFYYTTYHTGICKIYSDFGIWKQHHTPPLVFSAFMSFNRNRNLKTSKALLKSQAHQGTSLITSAATNQRRVFQRGSQEKLRSGFQNTKRGTEYM